MEIYLGIEFKCATNLMMLNPRITIIIIIKKETVSG